jgi:hypothetical protein
MIFGLLDCWNFLDPQLMNAVTKMAERADGFRSACGVSSSTRSAVNTASATPGKRFASLLRNCLTTSFPPPAENGVIRMLATSLFPEVYLPYTPKVEM